MENFYFLLLIIFLAAPTNLFAVVLEKGSHQDFKEQIISIEKNKTEQGVGEDVSMGLKTSYVYKLRKLINKTNQKKVDSIAKEKLINRFFNSSDISDWSTFLKILFSILIGIITGLLVYFWLYVLIGIWGLLSLLAFIGGFRMLEVW